jgi:hypothetical protein
MKSSTILELTPRPLERIESDVAVAGFFADERPLRGGIARADWRLCGGLSKRIERGDLLGGRGDAMLMGCGRALRAPRLLVVGLGARQDFDLVRLSDEMSGAMRRCVGLRCFDIALSPLGVAPDDLPRHAPALIAGIREACLDAGTRLRIRLCVQASEISGVQRAFEEACKAARVDDIEVRVLAASRPPSAPLARTNSPAAL